MDLNVSWADWIGLAVALAALAVAVGSWRAQADPEVVVYAIPDLTRPSVVNLIIENIGRGIARDVRFVTSKRMPHLAFGFEGAKVAEPMVDGPLIHGIAFMHPGERRIITWGQYHGLKNSLDGPVNITASYRSQPPYWPWRVAHDTVSVIDMESLKHFDVSDRNWDKKAAEALEKIARTLDSVIDRRALRVRELEDDDKRDGEMG